MTEINSFENFSSFITQKDTTIDTGSIKQIKYTINQLESFGSEQGGVTTSEFLKLENLTANPEDVFYASYVEGYMDCKNHFIFAYVKGDPVDGVEPFTLYKIKVMDNGAYVGVNTFNLSANTPNTSFKVAIHINAGLSKSGGGGETPGEGNFNYDILSW